MLHPAPGGISKSFGQELQLLKENRVRIEAGIQGRWAGLHEIRHESVRGRPPSFGTGIEK